MTAEQGFFTKATSAEVVISCNARAQNPRLAQIMAILPATSTPP